MNSKIISMLNIVKVFGAFVVVICHYSPTFFDVKFYSFGTGLFFVAAGFYAFNFEKTSGFFYFMKKMAKLFPSFMIATFCYLAVKDFDYSQWPLIILHHSTFLLTAPTKGYLFTLNAPFWAMPAFICFYIAFAIYPTFKISWLRTGAFMLSSFVVCWLMQDRWFIGATVLFSVTYFFYIFFVGGLIGKLSIGVKQNLRRYDALALLMVTSVMLAGSYNDELQQLGVTDPMFALLMAIIYGLFVWSLLRSHITLKNFAFMDFLGKISFGIYLFHNVGAYLVKPYLNGWLGATTALLITIVISWFVSKYIEQPIYLRVKRNSILKPVVT